MVLQGYKGVSIEVKLYIIMIVSYRGSSTVVFYMDSYTD